MRNPGQAFNIPIFMNISLGRFIIDWKKMRSTGHRWLGYTRARTRKGASPHTMVCNLPYTHTI
jgi:hypothetical protein